jgi:diaminopimelate decarboxylase
MRVNEIQGWFLSHNIKIENVNVGGGLGVNYHEPDPNMIPDFKSYFKLFHDFLELQPGQKVHFELGRAVVAQCGTLVSRVLYIKKGVKTNFVILDAGMTELMRPALYQAYHKIENLSKPASSAQMKYDVVGPICESSDCFGKAVDLPETLRGDIVVLRTAGAYGEVMSNGYNLRDKVKAVYG